MQDRIDRGSGCGRNGALLRLLVNAAALFAISAVTVYPAHAQSQGDAPEGFRSASLVFGGYTVRCSSAGLPVIWEASHSLSDVGVTIPAGRWTLVRYNPLVLNQMSDRLKLFWLGHECGHAYLRTTDESRADCWSATTGVHQGWFDNSNADELAIEMKNNPGDSTHPPGAVRVARVRDCITAASSGGGDSGGAPATSSSSDGHSSGSSGQDAEDHHGDFCYSLKRAIRSAANGSASLKGSRVAPGIYKSRMNIPGTADCQIIEGGITCDIDDPVTIADQAQACLAPHGWTRDNENNFRPSDGSADPYTWVGISDNTLQVNH